MRHSVALNLLVIFFLSFLRGACPLGLCKAFTRSRASLGPLVRPATFLRATKREIHVTDQQDKQAIPASPSRIKYLNVNEWVLLASAGIPVLDVRSESEFSYAHCALGNTHSLPIFNDEERKIVGTIYKQNGREAAIKRGLDFYGPKMKGFITSAERITRRISQARADGSSTLGMSMEVGDGNEPNAMEYQSDQSADERPRVLLYCWRGGMRSQGVAFILDLYGFDVCVLQGGYKAYRNWVLQQLETQPGQLPLKIVTGRTGAGKTAALSHFPASGLTWVQWLQRAEQLRVPVRPHGQEHEQQQQQKQEQEQKQEQKQEPIHHSSRVCEGVVALDLEGIAGHRGSAFGLLGLPPQPSQEMFENLLGAALWRANAQLSRTSGRSSRGSVLVEHESRRIGHCTLPPALYKAMEAQSTPLLFLDVPTGEDRNASHDPSVGVNEIPLFVFYDGEALALWTIISYQ
jgi:tRNA 2-selenouridine synthase